MQKSREERLLERERRKKLEEEEEERRRREEEEEEEQEELFGASSSSEDGGDEAEGIKRLSQRCALRKSLNLPTDDETEDATEDSASENTGQKADQVAAVEANCVAIGAPGRDDPKPDTVAEIRIISEAESEVAVAEEEARDEAAAAAEGKAENQSAVVEDEAEIMDLTQPAEAAKDVKATLSTLVPDDEAASSDEALNIEKPTTLERVILKDRKKVAGEQ
eukprot:snap_masked-scaffold_1-processed-gene-30.26-mRNA-1 protein AED:1.00 eAED:1.00 QI:0/0/0/0/1/1/2/0/220